MERKLKPINVQERLREKELRIFSPEEFRRFFSVTLRAAQEFIKDHKTDLFVKLRNGLYALKNDFPSEFEIANRLYAPSYISFEFALAYYHMIPESVYSITSATTKTTRTFISRELSYEYYKIKREAYRGYHCIKIENVSTYIAEPEKALVDYLYFVDLKLRSLNDRLRLNNIRKKTVLFYTSLFKRESLSQLIREIL